MMFTPWGPRAVPTGGAGVAAPACSCTLTRAAIFFLGGIPSSLSRGPDGGRPLPHGVAQLIVLRVPYGVKIAVAVRRRRAGARPASDLLDLAEAQLDRGLPAEDLDEGLHPLGLGVDLGDRRVQRGERAVDHHD